MSWKKALIATIVLVLSVLVGVLLTYQSKFGESSLSRLLVNKNHSGEVPVIKDFAITPQKITVNESVSLELSLDAYDTDGNTNLKSFADFYLFDRYYKLDKVYLWKDIEKVIHGLELEDCSKKRVIPCHGVIYTGNEAGGSYNYSTSTEISATRAGAKGYLIVLDDQDGNHAWASGLYRVTK